MYVLSTRGPKLFKVDVTSIVVDTISTLCVFINTVIEWDINQHFFVILNNK